MTSYKEGKMVGGDKKTKKYPQTPQTLSKKPNSAKGLKCDVGNAKQKRRYSILCLIVSKVCHGDIIEIQYKHATYTLT